MLGGGGETADMDLLHLICLNIFMLDSSKVLLDG